MTAQQRALAKHGTLRQLHKYAEECAEAAAAVLRWLAEPTPEHYAQMIEEMADVEICTAYPRLIFGDDDIDKAAASKLSRLGRMVGKWPNILRRARGGRGATKKLDRFSIKSTP